MSSKKLKQSYLQQSIKNLTNTIEKINQTPKKIKNLFYIKSKHTKKYFNNHPYFRSSTEINQHHDSQKYLQEKQIQTKPKRISIINQQRLKTQSVIQTNKKIHKKQHTQFVGLPTQYGIQNAYRFLQQKSFLGNVNYSQQNQKQQHNRYSNSLQRSRRMSLKYPSFHENQQNLSENGKNYMRATAAYQSRLFTTVESKRIKDLSLGADDTKNIQLVKFKHSFQTSKQRFNKNSRRVSLSVSNQPQLHQSKFSKDQRHTIQSNVIYNTPLIRRASTNFDHLPASHQVKFLYGKRLKSIQQIPYRFISFDLFQPIMATFLKCKIHYKDMNQAQYNFISSQIKRVLKENKKPQKYDIKDIINISNMKQLINFIKQYKDEDYEMTEIVRYFFLIQEQKVLKYHLQKVKENVANLISIKFDAQFGKKELFLFDLDTKNQVTEFYDILKGQKFIIGDDPNVLNDYLSLENKKSESQHLQSKIKKWKSIAQCQTLSSVKNSRIENATEPIRSQSSGKSSIKKIVSLISSRKLSDEKFNLIFEQFKIRQQKRMSKHIKLGDQKPITHKSRESFIERSMLKKEQDFFQ